MTFDDIEDLLTDKNFDLVVRHGDFVGAKGRDAFEQKLRARVSENVIPVLGEMDKQNAIRRTELELERVAKQMDELESLAAYSAAFSEDKKGVLEVELVYDTGERLTFEVSE